MQVQFAVPRVQHRGDADLSAESLFAERSQRDARRIE